MADLVIQPYTIQNIIDLFNQKIPGDNLFEAEALPYLDSVIDDINTNLNACYPTFTDVYSQNSNKADATVYDYIPKNYIRSVVMPGAAFKYYTTDEEGIGAATQYGYDYKNAMFFMVRDFSAKVPFQYRALNQGFTVTKQGVAGYCPPDDNVNEVFTDVLW